MVHATFFLATGASILLLSSILMLAWLLVGDSANGEKINANLADAGISASLHDGLFECTGVAASGKQCAWHVALVSYLSHVAGVGRAWGGGSSFEDAFCGIVNMGHLSLHGYVRWLDGSLASRTVALLPESGKVLFPGVSDILNERLYRGVCVCVLRCRSVVGLRAQERVMM